MGVSPSGEEFASRLLLRPVFNLRKSADESLSTDFADLRRLKNLKETHPYLNPNGRS
jgi:hypothetical protein